MYYIKAIHDDKQTIDRLYLTYLLMKLTNYLTFGLMCVCIDRTAAGRCVIGAHLSHAAPSATTHTKKAYTQHIETASLNIISVVKLFFFSFLFPPFYMLLRIQLLVLNII